MRHNYLAAAAALSHGDRVYAEIQRRSALVTPLRPGGDPAKRGDIEAAYHDLLYLVAEVGREYPDASAKVAVHWGVSTEALGELYDSEQPGI